jgi:hypothetical protein
MMPPMLRRLFTVLSALSLLLCVAAVVLWVRGISTRDRMAFGWADGWLVRVGSGEGRMWLVVVRDWPVPQPLRWETEPVGGRADELPLPRIILAATRAPPGGRGLGAVRPSGVVRPRHHRVRGPVHARDARVAGRGPRLDGRRRDRRGGMCVDVVRFEPSPPPQGEPLPRLRLRPHRQRQRHMPGVRQGRRKGGRMTRRLLRRPRGHPVPAAPVRSGDAVS